MKTVTLVLSTRHNVILFSWMKTFVLHITMSWLLTTPQEQMLDIVCMQTVQWKLGPFHYSIQPLITRFMGPTWGPSGADKTQVGPMLAPWTLLSGTPLRYTPTGLCPHDGVRCPGDKQAPRHQQPPCWLAYGYTVTWVILRDMQPLNNVRERSATFWFLWWVQLATAITWDLTKMWVWNSHLLWNVKVVSATLLSKSLSNLKAIKQFQTQISRTSRLCEKFQ